MSLPNYANLEFGNNNIVNASKKIMNFERQASEIYKQANADPLTSTGTSPKDAVDEMLLGLNEINANISQLKTYTDESKRKERKYAPTQEAFDNAIETEAKKLGNIPEKIPQINLHKSIDTGTFQPFTLSGSGLKEQASLRIQIKAIEQRITKIDQDLYTAELEQDAHAMQQLEELKHNFVEELDDLKDRLKKDMLLPESQAEIGEKIKEIQDKQKAKAKPEPEPEIPFGEIGIGEPEGNYDEENKEQAKNRLYSIYEDEYNEYYEQGIKFIEMDFQYKKPNGEIIQGFVKYPKNGKMPKKFSTFRKGIDTDNFKYGVATYKKAQAGDPEDQPQEEEIAEAKETIQQRIDEGLFESPTLNPIISVLTKLTTLIAKQSVLFNGRIKKNINFLDRVELDNLVNAVNKTIALFNQIDFDFIAVVINNGNNMINNVVNAFNKLSRDLYLGAQSYTTTYKGGMILDHLHGRTVRQNPYNYKYLM
jgi:hypothetical protein